MVAREKMQAPIYVEAGLSDFGVHVCTSRMELVRNYLLGIKRAQCVSTTLSAQQQSELSNIVVPVCVWGR